LTDLYRPEPDSWPPSGPGPDEIKIDIEALHRRIAELNQENSRLAEAIVARDALLFVAGHELRNPITPILGRLQLLKRLVAKPEISTDRVQRTVEQIEWLLNQYMKRAGTLLDVSRMTSGKLMLDNAPVDVCPIIRQVIETFRPIADHAGCEINADLPENELWICGDSLAVEEIVDNLVSNAIKYGRGKPIVIRALADAPEGRVYVEVRDQGRGISTAEQARVFERFERAVRLGEQRAGFGVGLWIVRQLAEAMGGGIRIMSDSGAGSNFCVSLPAQPSGESK
jgi:signal transduction histidine kinase